MSFRLKSKYQKKCSWFAFEIHSTERSLIKTSDWKPGDIIRFEKKESVTSLITLSSSMVVDYGQTMLISHQRDAEDITAETYYTGLFGSKYVDILKTPEEKEASFLILTSSEVHASPYFMFMFLDTSKFSPYYNSKNFILVSSTGIVEIWSAWLPRLEKCFNITHIPQNLKELDDSNQLM